MAGPSTETPTKAILPLAAQPILRGGRVRRWRGAGVFGGSERLWSRRTEDAGSTRRT